MNKLAKEICSKLTASLLVMALALNLFGCAKNDEPDTKEAVESTEIADSVDTASADTESDKGNSEVTEASDSDIQATVYPLEITDSYGNVITIEEEPQRIVSVAPNLTELIYELDAAEKLVGRSDYCDYPAEAAEVESVGLITPPDIEKIISLEPDVVLVSTHFDEENAQKLAELNIPVVALYEEKDVTGVYALINTLGEVLNCNEEAALLVGEMEQTFEEVAKAVDGLEKPSVYYVVGFGEYGDYTAGGDTFVAGLLDMAGGENIAKEISGWNITFEKIMEADPDIIVISEDMKEAFMTTENYTELTAVKEGNVYTIDTNMLDRQGYRNAEGVKELAKIFHPEAF